MTLTNEQIQELLEKSESDTLELNGNEISNQLRHLANNEIDSDSFAVVTENYNGREVEFERPITDLAIDAAEMMDKLLAEREADKALIAKAQADATQWKELVDAFCSDDVEWHKLTNSNNELISSLSTLICKQADRIAELEVRTLTVDLQYERFAYGESDYDDGHARGWNAHKIEVEKALRSACAAAGITLVVGGEDATHA